MSQFFVSGPALAWVAPPQATPGTIPSAGSFSFVGFTRRGLRVDLAPQNEDIEVDYAGRMPGDVAQLGQEVAVSGTYSRYNESVINTMLNWVQAAGSSPGFGPNYVVGSLYLTEGYTFPLLVYSPYGFKNAYSGAMVPGFLFYAAYLSNPYAAELSVRQKTPDIGWRALPVFGTGANASAFAAGSPYQAYEIYTNTHTLLTPGGIPAVN